MWITDWTTRAACKGTDPDELFVQGAAQNRAKLICRGCPVRTECLADALDNGIEFGVWGGMTERERRALLRRGPMSSRGANCSRRPATVTSARASTSSSRARDPAGIAVRQIRNGLLVSRGRQRRRPKPDHPLSPPASARQPA